MISADPKTEQEEEIFSYSYSIISEMRKVFCLPWDGSSGIPKGKSSSLSHKNVRSGHLVDILPSHIEITSSLDGRECQFTIGDEELESDYPHYHILNDTKLIRKPSKGTSKSKGSQDSVKPSERDYGKWSYKTNQFGEIEYGKDGKAVKYQEYRSKNYRGNRAKENKSTSTFFSNKYYSWIESTFDKAVSEACSVLNLSYSRSSSESLEGILSLL